MNASQMKHAAQLAAWKERIIECRGSGISVKAWCQQNGWNASTYYRWEREICGQIGDQPDSGHRVDEGSADLVPVSSTMMVEIPITEQKVNASQIESHSEAFCPVAVVRKGSLELKLANGISPRLLRQLEKLLAYAE